MSNVTNIKHARVAREMRVPLSTPVVQGGDLPAPVAKAMDDGFEAAIKFRDRIIAYVKNQNTSAAIAMARAYARFLRKTTPPDGDSFEARMIAGIFSSEFEEIHRQWIPIFGRLNAGKNVEVDLRSLWPFKPTEASKRRQQHPAL
jgi:hypothetical protein